jgi:hypothetical protein
MEGLGLIELSEAARKLGYNKRAFISWCKKHAVTIYNHIKGRPVNKVEFENAVNQPLIEKLKSQFGEKWEKIYLAILDNDYSGAINLTETKPFTGATNDAIYHAKSQTGKDFIKKLKDKWNH